VISALAFGLVTAFTMGLSYLESQKFIGIMFEVASAAGLWDCPPRRRRAEPVGIVQRFRQVHHHHHDVSGAVGSSDRRPLCRQEHEDLRYRYPEARVVIG